MKSLPRRKRSAFSLVEVTIALGIAGFCLLAILGLLQTGLASERSTVERTSAVGIASAIFANLSTGSLLVTNTSTPVTLWFSDAGQEATNVSSARYRATIQRHPPSGTGKVPTTYTLIVSWPPEPDVPAGQLPSKPIGSVEIVTALDLN